ncbi:MAG: fasciclin domain-containing protein, partial [Limisphaerales bacterium]
FLMKFILSLLLVGASLSAKADNIVNVASNAGNFNTLLKAAVEADLANTLSEDGPFTVFAPTDSAFEKLPDEVIISLLKKENKDKLVNILKFHVISGSYPSDKLPLLPLKTLNGQDVNFKVDNGDIFINGAKVLKANINASNGIIHVIDGVLTPPKSITEASAKGIIVRGIQMGVPQFNHGNHSACADIYEISLRSLLMLPDAKLSEANRKLVSKSLLRLSEMDSSTEKAWEARSTFDKLMLSEL